MVTIIGALILCVLIGILAYAMYAEGAQTMQEISRETVE